MCTATKRSIRCFKAWQIVRHWNCSPLEYQSCLHRNKKQTSLFCSACSAAQSSASRSIASSELADWEGVSSAIRRGWGLPENHMRSCRMTLYNPGFSCSFRNHINIQSGCWSGERLHWCHCLLCLTFTGVCLQDPKRPPQRSPHRRHGSDEASLESFDSGMPDAFKQCPKQLLYPVTSHEAEGWHDSGMLQA